MLISISELVELHGALGTSEKLRFAPSSADNSFALVLVQCVIAKREAIWEVGNLSARSAL